MYMWHNRRLSTGDGPEFSRCGLDRFVSVGICLVSRSLSCPQAVGNGRGACFCRLLSGMPGLQSLLIRGSRVSFAFDYCQWQNNEQARLAGGRWLILIQIEIRIGRIQHIHRCKRNSNNKLQTTHMWESISKYMPQFMASYTDTTWPQKKQICIWQVINASTSWTPLQQQKHQEEQAQIHRYFCCCGAP